MKTLFLLILLVLLFAACNQPASSRTQNSSEAEESAASNTIAPNQFMDSLSYDLLCKPLDTINTLFAHVKDSIFESEGVEWPGKFVTHDDGTWTIFESSWDDKKRIYRVTTTSKKRMFNSLYKVGDKVATISQRGDEITFNEGDGGESFYFTGEHHFSLGFSVEKKYAHEFYQRVYQNFALDPATELNPAASIEELTIVCNCQK